MSVVSVPVRYIFSDSDVVEVYVDAWDPELPILYGIEIIPSSVRTAYENSSENTVIGAATVDLSVFDESDLIISLHDSVIDPVSDEDFNKLIG